MSNFSPRNLPILFKDDWHTTGLAYDIAQVDRDALFKEYNMLVQCAPRRSDRNKPYFVGHKGRLSAEGGSKRREEHLAVALWNLNGLWPRPDGSRFCLLDYQFPLKARQGDKGIRAVDLLGITAQRRLMVIELKVKPHDDHSRGETPVAALMQGLRYAAVVQANLAVIAAEVKQRFNVTINAEPPIVQVLAPQAWWRGWLGILGSTRDAAGDWEPAFTKLAQDIENGLGVSVECVALDDLDDIDITFGLDRKTPQLDHAPALYPVRPDEVLPIGKALSQHQSGVSAG